MIDLRSDTVTQPSLAMLQQMMAAPTGDDVYGEDPTVNALEEKCASLFGKEAALFCSSGTLSNQLAIKCHTQPGDEVICDADAHIYQYEAGGIAFNSGASVQLISGDRGRINAQQVLEAIQPNDIHKPISRLVAVENTSNRGGGSCYELTSLQAIHQVCKDQQLAFHLDGARLFNALVARNETPIEYGSIFDSISICLSKGLGCPVGSVLLGSQVLIQKARRFRKILGGGMRQAGYLAAAGIYALDHHIDRLLLDHLHAREVAQVLETCSWVHRVIPVETNILIFESKNRPARDWVSELKHRHILCNAVGPHSLRFVFHLGITDSMVAQILETIQQVSIKN